MQETQVLSLSQEDPLEEGMVAHSNVLAWEIPWTEEPGGQQSMGSQKVGHDWATKHAKYIYSEKNLHISGPTEFKPMFKGQEYVESCDIYIVLWNFYWGEIHITLN